MRKTAVCFGICLALSAAVLRAANPAASPTSVPHPAQVTAVSTDGSWLEVIEDTSTPQAPVDRKDWPTVRFTVAPAELKASVQKLQPDDLVKVRATGTALEDVVIRKSSPSVLRRLATLFVSALALWLFTFLLLGRRQDQKILRRFLVGMDNRYSKSKFQIAIWFTTVIVSYLATVYLRWWASDPSLVGGVDIPQNLLLLSGISALSFAGAKGITQGKQNNQERATGSAQPVKAPARSPRFPADLVTDDSGQPDLGDFQMVVITVLAVVLYLVKIFSWLGLLELRALVSLPDVDSTLLGIFGISHGTYLAKKAVSGNDGAPVDRAPQAEGIAAASGVSGPRGPV